MRTSQAKELVGPLPPALFEADPLSKIGKKKAENHRGRIFADVFFDYC